MASSAPVASRSPTGTSDAAMAELFAHDGPVLLCVEQDAELR